MPLKEFNRLKVVLVEKKKSQRWLANEIGVTEHAVSRWCNNHQQPPIETLYRVAELLEVDIYDLLIPIEPKKKKE